MDSPDKIQIPVTSGDISVCLLEDDPILRESLGAVLRNASGFLPPWLCAHSQEAMRAVSRTPPDVMLVDLKLPSDSGLRFLRTMRPRLPRTRILILTGSDQEEFIVAALEAGADGYLTKGGNLGEIIEAVRRAAAGELVFSSPVLRKVLSEYRIRHQPAQTGVRLTKNEERLLELTDAGWSCQAIAKEMKRSIHTVYAMNKELYPKLRVTSRSAAAAAWRRMREARQPSPAGSPAGQP